MNKSVKKVVAVAAIAVAVGTVSTTVIPTTNAYAYEEKYSTEYLRGEICQDDSKIKMQNIYTEGNYKVFVVNVSKDIFENYGACLQISSQDTYGYYGSVCNFDSTRFYDSNECNITSSFNFDTQKYEVTFKINESYLKDITYNNPKVIFYSNTLQQIFVDDNNGNGYSL